VVALCIMVKPQEDSQGMEGYDFAELDRQLDKTATGSAEESTAIEGAEEVEARIEDGEDIGIVSNPAMLGGRIVDEGGTPLGGASVRAVWMKGTDKPMSPSKFKSFETRTGEDGRFAYEDLPEGAYAVRALWKSLAGHLEVAVTDQKSDGDTSSTDQEIVLKSAGSISGWVVNPEGFLVKDVVVMPQRARGAFDRTNGQGRFSLKGLQKGKYTIAAIAGGFLPKTELGIMTGTSDLEIILKTVGGRPGEGITANKIPVSQRRTHGKARPEQWPRGGPGVSGDPIRERLPHEMQGRRPDRIPPNHNRRVPPPGASKREDG
jgi:hypothetical protein